MIICDPRADQSKKIVCVEKQIGWDIIHYTDKSYDVFKVPVGKGQKRGRAIL